MRSSIGRLLMLTAILAALILPGRAASQSDLAVLKSEAEAQAESQLLYDYLTRIARDYLDQREREIAAISTPAQAEARKRLIRERILALLGPLPKKTDLKAQVTGRLEREGYTVENVVYQSQPGFYVTANLYIPAAGKKPFPAVLGTCGHTNNGKAAAIYQTLWISLAKMGFVVLSFDPPGQGERMMYWNADLGEPLPPGTTTDHSLSGIQCMLTGTGEATYFIWDMIRSLDYLLSRPEVDPQRVAVTGNSGGGTQTAYIAALDDRLTAAVPSCYMTAWRRLWETIGPQDAEQNMLPFIGSGLDFGDFAIAFAPRPFLMNLAIQDFFSILGARETYAEVKRIYELYGAGDKFAKFEADDQHGYSRPRREACMGWLGKYMLGLEGPQKEPELTTEWERNLWASPTGQVLTSYRDAQTVASLNATYAQKIMPAPRLPNSVESFERWREELLGKVRKLTGFERFTTALNLQNRGSIWRPGMSIELITYDPEPGITLPALFFRPDSVRRELPAVLYAADWSKSEDAAGDIAALAAGGRPVLAPDVRGKGEGARLSGKSGPFQDWLSRDWALALMAFHVNKSLVGMRAVDLVRSLDALAELCGDRKSGMTVLAKGSAGVPALHAAALDNRISSVIIEGGLASWKAVVEAKYHRGQLDNAVLGALAQYDLPLLASALAPRTLVLSNTSDPMGHVLPLEQAALEYQAAAHCYKILNRSQNLRFAIRQEGLEVLRAYPNALSE